MSNEKIENVNELNEDETIQQVLEDSQSDRQDEVVEDSEVKNEDSENIKDDSEDTEEELEVESDDDSIDSDSDESSKQSNGYEKRINKLTRQKKDAQEALERLQAENERLKALKESEYSGEDLASSGKSDVAEPSQDMDAFFERKLTEHEYRRQAQKEQERRIEKWNEKYSAALDTYSDFENAESEFADQIVNMAAAKEVHNAILDAEHGPDIIMYLTKNPSRLENISKMPAHKAVMELGKIETRFSKPKPKVTKTPPSINVESKGSSSNLNDMSDEQVLAWVQSGGNMT